MMTSFYLLTISWRRYRKRLISQLKKDQCCMYTKCCYLISLHANLYLSFVFISLQPIQYNTITWYSAFQPSHMTVRRRLTVPYRTNTKHRRTLTKYKYTSKQTNNTYLSMNIVISFVTGEIIIFCYHSPPLATSKWSVYQYIGFMLSKHPISSPMI